LQQVVDSAIIRAIFAGEQSMSENFSAAVMSLIDQHGGVGGLLQKFEQGGLGAVASSWVDDSTPNQPVSPDDLHQALGSDTVQSAAQQSGMSTDVLLQQLAAHLPDLINHLTPNGQVPEPSTSAGGGLLDMAAGFLRRRLG
jgi:uncharacterized protein YidB (DUF937 family)